MGGGRKIIRQVWRLKFAFHVCKLWEISSGKNISFSHSPFSYICVHRGKNGKVSVVRILFANLNLTFTHTRLLSQSSCYFFVCWLTLWEDLSAAKNDAIWIKCEWYKHLCTNMTPSCGINQKHLCNGAKSNILGACTFYCELNVAFSTEFSLLYLFSCSIMYMLECER